MLCIGEGVWGGGGGEIETDFYHFGHFVSVRLNWGKKIEI